LLLECLLAQLLFGFVLVDSSLMFDFVLDVLELLSVLGLALCAFLFQLQISLDPSLHLLVFLYALVAVIFLLLAADLDLVLPTTHLRHQLVALGAAVVDDTVTPGCAFVDAAFQGGIAKSS
jgi:hypothetical protein